MPDISELEDEVASLEAQEAELAKKAYAARNRLRKAQEKLYINSHAGVYGIEEVLTAMLPQGENSIGYNFLKSLGNATSEYGIDKDGGYYPATNQYCMGIHVNADWTDEQLNKLSGYITAVLPFIKPGSITDNPDWRTFGVTDRDLSASGVVYLVAHSDGTWSIEKICYGHWNSPEFVGDLMGALRFIRAHHWYEGGSSDSVDEDDWVNS